MTIKEQILVIDSVTEKHFPEQNIEAEVLSDYQVSLVHIASAAELTSEVLDNISIIILWACIPAIQFDDEVFERMPNCKTIIKAAVGYDNVDLDAAKRRGIEVYNTPDYGTEEVADHSIALMLACLRNLTQANDHVKSGAWDWSVVKPLKRIRGQKLGIIGFGRIGIAMAKRAEVFGLDIRFYDPFLASGVDKSHGVKRCETLEDLLADSDIISIHCSLNPSSEHLLNKQTLCALKTGAVVVNTARGGIIESAALVEALTNGKVAAAGLDVAENEPNIAPQLLKMDNVILTPHCAFYSEEAFTELRTKPAELAKKLLHGLPVRNRVN